MSVDHVLCHGLLMIFIGLKMQASCCARIQLSGTWVSSEIELTPAKQNQGKSYFWGRPCLQIQMAKHNTHTHLHTSLSGLSNHLVHPWCCADIGGSLPAPDSRYGEVETWEGSSSDSGLSVWLHYLRLRERENMSHCYKQTRDSSFTSSRTDFQTLWCQRPPNVRDPSKNIHSSVYFW